MTGLLTGVRVLVVEDNEAERMLISLYLQQLGCRVYQAHDGIDGIHKARLVVPDMVLLDVDMPRCDGTAVCRLLHDDPALGHIPVIFLSAHDGPNERVRGLLAGAVDYIGKPFNFDEVRLRMVVHLRGRGAASPAGPQVSTRQGASDTASHLHSILFHSARVHLLGALAETPDLHQLARLAGTNAKRLNEAFRECTGGTVFEYLREERMKEAWRLLHHTPMAVGDIAAQVGYQSSANFATAFKARFGVSPSAARRGDA